MLPVHRANYSKLTKALLLGLVGSFKGLLQEESDLPKVCITDGFDLNAYKLMEKSGYDFSKPPFPGHIIKSKPYGLNEMQEMI